MFQKISLSILVLGIISWNLSFAAPSSLEDKKPSKLEYVKESPEVRIMPISDKDLRIKEPKVLENANSKPNNKPQIPRSCENTKQMMEKRLDVLETNLQKRKSLLVKTKNIVNSKISDLKSRGVDTSTVEENFNSYLQKLDNAFKLREGNMMVLADLTRFDCAGDPSNFKNNLKDYNQRFKNHNLEFNKLNRDLRVLVFYEIAKLNQSLKTVSDSENKEGLNE